MNVHNQRNHRATASSDGQLAVTPPLEQQADALIQLAQQQHFWRFFRIQPLALPTTSDDFPGFRKQSVPPPLQIPHRSLLLAGHKASCSHDTRFSAKIAKSAYAWFTAKDHYDSLPNPVLSSVLILFSHRRFARCPASKYTTLNHGALVKKRGDQVSVRIEPDRFRSGMQPLSPQIDPRRVDHPRIITLISARAQRWLPILLLINPPNEPFHDDRQRI